MFSWLTQSCGMGHASAMRFARRFSPSWPTRCRRGERRKARTGMQRVAWGPGAEMTYEGLINCPTRRAHFPLASLGPAARPSSAGLAFEEAEEGRPTWLGKIDDVVFLCDVFFMQIWLCESLFFSHHPEWLVFTDIRLRNLGCESTVSHHGIRPQWPGFKAALFVLSDQYNGLSEI